MIAELIGISLVGYGIWFTAEGVKQLSDAAKDWWRPTKGKRRYPYPASGVLLGICFVLMGLVFALHNVWVHARSLGYAGVAVFVLVLVTGIGQPRFLHPRWYGELEDRFGKKGMIRLKRAALATEDAEWNDVVASEVSFDEWANRVMPRQMRKPRRGYKKSTNGE